MLVVLPVGPQDREQAIRWLDWVEELGGIGNHRLMVACARRVQNPTELSRSYELYIPHDEDERGWPMSPNHLFKRVVQHISWSPNPEAFFWCEPDCIPLVSGWIDLLESEYKACGQYFMGANVKVDNTPEHMSGNAIYPKNVMERAWNLIHADLAAFDVVGAEQIIGQAHWTKSIQHVWRKDQNRNFTFPDQKTVDAMVDKHAVVFHQNKDGTLIERLREKRSGGINQPSTSSTKPKMAKKSKKTTTDLFIRSYRKDFPWLKYCLKSCLSRASKFSNIHVVVPKGDEAELTVPDGVIVHTCPRYDNDYLGQQVTKLTADQYTEASVICHIDSDTVWTSDVTPSVLMPNKKPVIYYEPYSSLGESGSHWKGITGAALGRIPDYEFMRMPPHVFPRWVYGEIRDHMLSTHKLPFDAYILKLRGNDFSEYNLMGAYLWENHREKFEWRLCPTKDKCLVKQFWSWGGIDTNLPELDKIT